MHGLIESTDLHRKLFMRTCQNVGIMNSCFLLLQQLLVLLLLDAVMYYCTDIIISQNVCYDWSINWPHFIAWHAKLKYLLELKSFPSIWT